MDLEQKMLIKQQGIDKLNDDIKWIENSKKELLKDIKEIKEEVIINNYHLIGREAILEKEDGSKSEGTCSKIEVGDDLKIKLFFSYGSKINSFFNLSC